MPMAKQPLTIEHALLGFVRQQPAHGYEIHQHMLATEALGLVWNIKQSLLYALLARLEGEGYLAADLELQGGKPPRKVFRLTEGGATVFGEWVTSAVEHGRDFRLEFLAKLYFAHREGAAATLIANQRWRTGTLITRLREQAHAAAPDSYDWLVLQFRIGQLEAAYNWLGLCTTWAQNADGRTLPMTD